MSFRRWPRAVGAVAFATLSCSASCSAYGCQLAFPTVEATSTSAEGGALGTDGANGSRDGEVLFSEAGTPDAEDGAPPKPAGPSCNALAKTCGGDRDCCASAVVPGGTFARSYDKVTANDPTNTATIASHRLDVFEVTVGRFRKFVSAFPASKPGVGTGKNPNNPADPGWLATFNLPPDAASFGQGMNACGGHTWTDLEAGTENRPINCIRWAEAFAFCIWDGGRLPTEAEWNFAAAGGDAQRIFPWPPPTPIDGTRAVFNATEPLSVGSRPLGDGLWGHADLAGNVAEWTLDFKSGNYINPCSNCAELSNLSERMARGGGFDQSEGPQHVADRGSRDPNNRFANVGVRCAHN